MGFGRKGEREAPMGMGSSAGGQSGRATGGRGSWAVVPDERIRRWRASARRARACCCSPQWCSLWRFFLVLGASALIAGRVGLLGVACALVAATLAAMSVHIAQQWEKVVVAALRAASNRVSGPGLFWTWPVIEQNTMRVDGRVRVTTFGAEETLTADLVPLDVNAVLFWHVWDAKAACTEVGDFTRGRGAAAQTALRDAHRARRGRRGGHPPRAAGPRAQTRARREGGALGVAILSVEVRDILVPKDLQDVMSLEAQAEQRKKGAHHPHGGRAGHLRDDGRDGRRLRQKNTRSSVRCTCCTRACAKRAAPWWCPAASARASATF